MTFSVSQLKESLKFMSPDERKAAETQILADYARHAAFARPLASAGLSRVFATSSGMEEAALAEDKDVISIRTLDAFKAALETRSQPLLLIRSGTDISENEIYHLLEQSVTEKTIFLVQ